MLRSTFAHIDLDAIAANYRAITAFLAGESPGGSPPSVIAVVKANAYGHGAGPVARALEQAGAEMLACADIEEAVALRTAGVRAGILVFGAMSVSDLGGLFEHDLVPTISTPTAARAVEAEAARRATQIRYHLKIDTGMHRLGFRHDSLRQTLPELLASPHLQLAAVYTHFATAEDPEHPLMERQRAAFDGALATLADMGVPPRGATRPTAPRCCVTHASGSTRFAQACCSMASPPPPLATTVPVHPAMRLVSRVVSIKGLRSGESVGYGARYTAELPRRIAVVPAGYADGLDRRLAGRGHVLVGGRRAPIVGSVSMDMITIDVTDVPCAPGDEVVLLGRQGGEVIDVREMAATIGTIPWEVLCRVGTRIERIYNPAEAF